jgi:hypothetical protein
MLAQLAWSCPVQRIRLEKAQQYRQTAMVRAAAIGRTGQVSIHLAEVRLTRRPTIMMLCFALLQVSFHHIQSKTPTVT